jgi:hypothetical protein
MILVAADTTPLRYLAEIGHAALYYYAGESSQPTTIRSGTGS